METEKISDGLLSWVLGCECEFDEILDNRILFIKGKKYTNSINLDTFIDLALYDWLDKVNYEFNISSTGIKIKKIFLPNMKGSDHIEVCMRTFSKYSDIPPNRKELILQCLEWVKNQIQEG